MILKLVWLITMRKHPLLNKNQIDGDFGNS